MGGRWLKGIPKGHSYKLEEGGELNDEWFILVVFEKMSFQKRRRVAEPAIPRMKQSRTVKSSVEDTFPFEVPNIDQLTPEIKQYIAELESQYL